MTRTCTLTGEQFDVSERERRLRARFELPDPEWAPWVRIRHLGAFWQQWGLHRSSCAATGKSIISVYSSACPYPVWAADEWLAHAEPPGAAWEPGESVVGQMGRLFPRCAIPHTFGAGNENCLYTDDYWYSKNCYLCHAGVNNQDLRYCYRMFGSKDSQFCAFAFNLERCFELVDCADCYNAIRCFRCSNCHDCAFLYDCRGCSDCLFCSNLRNKRYCINNIQLAPEEYARQRQECDLSSYRMYNESCRRFKEQVLINAVHRAYMHENAESSSGDYLRNCKNCEACFFAEDAEDCVNCVRGGEGLRDSLDCVGFDLNIELACSTVFVSDRCYDVRFCAHINECQFLEYCMFCTRCAHCFGCCGLVGKRFHIFNRPYQEEHYKALVTEIRRRMRENGEYGSFFPMHFAANPYDESFSSLHWSLSREEEERFGVRRQPAAPSVKNEDYNDIAAIPDRSADASAEISTLSFWDAVNARPFRILEEDIAFSRALGVPLPREFYLARLRRLFGAVEYRGKQRSARCSGCNDIVMTLHPNLYDRSILCERCYRDKIY